MFDDPIVDEIRHYRQEHAAQYGNDIKKIVAAMQEKQKQSPNEYVDLGPKLIPVETNN